MLNQAVPIAELKQKLQTESIRLSCFLDPSERPVEPTWWRNIAGAEPEARMSKPGRGELQESGAIGDRALTLSLLPGRVDWYITARLTPGALPEAPWAGSYDDVLAQFSELMHRWLRETPELVRLAAGIVVHLPVEDKEKGYTQLAGYIPGLIIDPHSEDFFYQINRPRMSRVVDALKMNRLSRWSVSQFMSFRLAISPQALQPNLDGGPFSCRFDLDLSTDGGRTNKLERETLNPLFEELMSMATELLTEGDVP